MISFYNRDNQPKLGGRLLVHSKLDTLFYPVLGYNQLQQDNSNSHQCASRNCYFDNYSHVLTSLSADKSSAYTVPHEYYIPVVNQDIGEPSK